MPKKTIKEKKVKHFDSHGFTVKMTKLNEQRNAYIKMLSEIKKIDKNSNNVEELESYLNRKTNFLNANVSALAFNLENEYEYIVNLSKQCTEINTSSLKEDNSFSDAFTNEVKESYTTYFSDEELEVKSILDDMMKAFNKLDIKYRSQTGIDSKYHFVYSVLSPLRK